MPVFDLTAISVSYIYFFGHFRGELVNNMFIQLAANIVCNLLLNGL